MVESCPDVLAPFKRSSGEGWNTLNRVSITHLCTQQPVGRIDSDLLKRTRDSGQSLEISVGHISTRLRGPFGRDDIGDLSFEDGKMKRVFGVEKDDRLLVLTGEVSDHSRPVKETHHDFEFPD